MRKFWRLLALVLLPSLLVLASGCGGVSASHSVSPASILVPGLLKADPQPASEDLVKPAPATAIARAH